MGTVQSREVSSDRNTRVSGARTSTSAAHAPIGASSVATRPASAADLPRIRPHPLPRDHTAHQYPAIFVNTGVNGLQPIPEKGRGKGLLRSLFRKHVARLQHPPALDDLLGDSWETIFPRWCRMIHALMGAVLPTGTHSCRRRH